MGNIVSKFISNLEEVLSSKGYNVSKLDKRNNIWSISDSNDLLVLVKVSSLQNGFWGLGKDNVDTLNDLSESEERKWMVVLLKGDEHTGYVLPDKVITEMIDSGKLSISKDMQYKINEKRNLESNKKYESFDEIVNNILR